MAELGKVFLVLVIRPTDHVEEEIRFCHIPPVPAREQGRGLQFFFLTAGQSGMWKSYNDVDQQERGRTSSERLLTSVMTLKDPPLHPPRLVVPHYP